jgi:hypothetical protein
MKKIVILLLVSTLLLTFTACSNGGVSPINATSQTQSTSEPESISSTVNVEYDGDDLDSSTNSADASHILLDGDSITLNGDGAVVDGNQIAITSAGTYIISGTLDDGQIIVNTKDQETVKLIFNGVDITYSKSSPIYVKNAKKTVITLADGTNNYIADGDSYIIEDSGIENPKSVAPNAAIFSKDDLTINGNGSLTVNANYYNGIQSKDDLKITGGNITVNAVNDGIKGRDSIAIKDGNITINARADGMQANNDTDSEKGYVSIEGGTINITAGEDGIQAETSLVVTGGDITVISGSGSANAIMKSDDMMNPIGNLDMEIDSDSETAGSTKGLKAGVGVTIEGGSINADSFDDSIHSNDSVNISGGNIALSSGDDAIHADAAIVINGGDINISKCYEGIDSPTITINDGNIHLIASDDGINATSGNAGFDGMGMPGQDIMEMSGDNYLSINGGYIVIDAAGDGLDINGPINMTGGVVIINGPTNNANGALDYLGTFTISGGFLIAAGSSGMAESPGTSSTQYSVMLNFSSSLPANTVIHIETEDGEEILTFVPTKTYQSIVFSSLELQKGETYVVYSGGSSTGSLADGLYSGGTYTTGTQITSFTISSTVTILGSSGGAFPGGGGGGGRRR